MCRQTAEIAEVPGGPWLSLAVEGALQDPEEAQRAEQVSRSVRLRHISDTAAVFCESIHSKCKVSNWYGGSLFFIGHCLNCKGKNG